MNNNDYNQNIQGSQLPCSPPIPSGEYTSYPADDIPSPYPAENFLYEPYATNDPGKSAATASTSPIRASHAWYAPLASQRMRQTNC